MMEVWWQSYSLKITVLSQATYLVSIGNNIYSHLSLDVSPINLHALLPMTSKTDKLPLETEPDVRDNNTFFTLKPGDQT